MDKKNYWLAISAALGFIAVALGAFGAHGLREQLPLSMIEIYKTGVFYQLIHTIIMITLSLNNKIEANLTLIFFLAGIILFSFSLYIYSITGIRIFAMITPIGGVSFLVGWISLFISALRPKTIKSQNE
jgi:uncharacterized membrane protein YgdD (TMEM256/DUF423 family)